MLCFQNLLYAHWFIRSWKPVRTSMHATNFLHACIRITHFISLHSSAWHYVAFPSISVPSILQFRTSDHSLYILLYQYIDCLLYKTSQHTHTHIIYTHILYVYKYYYFYIYICIYIVHLIYTPLHIYRKQLKDDFLNWSPRLPDDVIETSGRGRLWGGTLLAWPSTWLSYCTAVGWLGRP